MFTQIIEWEYGSHAHCENYTSSNVNITTATNNQQTDVTKNIAFYCVYF